MSILRNGLCAAALVFGVLILSAPSAPARDLPAINASGFNTVCEDMYRLRDTDAGWPAEPRGGAHHCTVSVGDATPADMTADDYAWALRKSLTFACKGKREVIYDVVRRLRHCDGGARSLEMTPASDTPGACQVRFLETDETFTVAPPLIDDLIDWRDDMPWYERILVDLFAPREMPMVMDGLIACGARTPE